jgi:hypothetical protein
MEPAAQERVQQSSDVNSKVDGRLIALPMSIHLHRFGTISHIHALPSWTTRALEARDFFHTNPFSFCGA